MLLDAGANKNMKNKEGKKPIEMKSKFDPEKLKVKKRTK